MDPSEVTVASICLLLNSAFNVMTVNNFQHYPLGNSWNLDLILI